MSSALRVIALRSTARRSISTPASASVAAPLLAATLAAAAALGACAGEHPMVASHPAVAHYAMDVDAARSAVEEALTERSLHVAPIGADGFVAGPECRTADGDPCPRARNAWSRGPAGGPVATFGLEVLATIAPAPSGVVVSVGAIARAGGETRYEVGKGDVPVWVQREVDDVLRSINHRLAPPPVVR